MILGHRRAFVGECRDQNTFVHQVQRGGQILSGQGYRRIAPGPLLVDDAGGVVGEGMIC